MLCKPKVPRSECIVLEVVSDSYSASREADQVEFTAVRTSYLTAHVVSCIKLQLLHSLTGAGDNEYHCKNFWQTLFVPLLQPIETL